MKAKDKKLMWNLFGWIACGTLIVMILTGLLFTPLIATSFGYWNIELSQAMDLSLFIIIAILWRRIRRLEKK